MPDNYPIHTWDQLTPQQLVAALPHALYPHVSALGAEVDTLASGAFEDEELPALLDRMRAETGALGKLVVALKRYNDGLDVPVQE